jgi:hypothetical protein
MLVSQKIKLLIITGGPQIPYNIYYFYPHGDVNAFFA